MAEGLFADRTALSALCRQYHIRRLSLFGSVLKGTARTDSDVDLLVEFEPGRSPGLLGIARIEAELSSLVGGHKTTLASGGTKGLWFRLLLPPLDLGDKEHLRPRRDQLKIPGLVDRAVDRDGGLLL